jgi:hypothetical protein
VLVALIRILRQALVDEQFQLHIGPPVRSAVIDSGCSFVIEYITALS